MVVVRLTTPDYYKIDVRVDIDGDEFEAELTCEELIRSLLERNKLEGLQAFRFGSVIKYLFRLGKKENVLFPDLYKSADYLAKMVGERPVGEWNDMDGE